jgi:hypothetical protein
LLKHCSSKILHKDKRADLLGRCDAGRPAHNGFTTNVSVSVECKDSSEHTAEFAVPAASLEHPHLGDWQHAVIPLAEGPQRLKGRIAELSIVVRARSAATDALTLRFQLTRYMDI